MKNLYIVESPLQALCALEVSLSKKDERHNLIVILSKGKDRERGNKQLLKIIKKIEWDSKVILTKNIFKKGYLSHIENKRYLKYIKVQFEGKIECIYIGEFRSPFMHMAKVAVNAPNMYLLDDGAVTVKVVDKYLEKGFNYPYDTFYPKNIFKKNVFKYLYRGYINEKLLNNDIKLITAFSKRESERVDKIGFENIKEIFNSYRDIDDSLVYYFGSKYSEVGIISKEYEIIFLKKIYKFYQDKNKKLIYFAHRRESEDKLNYVSNNIGFSVLIPDVTAEMYLLENEVLPGEIAGAYTSVINNVRIIFPEISLRCFKLDSNEVGEKWREDIEEIYLYYSNYNINIET